MTVSDADCGLLADTTDDIFLGGELLIRQPVRGYRAGSDAVLLAAAVSGVEPDGAPILDIGAGVGTVGLCIAKRVPGVKVVLAERQAALVALARFNIDRNGLSQRVSALEADITQATRALSEAGIESESFGHVLANPPYHDRGRGTVAGSALKAVSHQMESDDLEAWARFMTRMARPDGRATMIHKADALPRLLAAFDGRFGNIHVLPIQPRAGACAIRVIVTGVKGSRAPMTLRPPLVLHTAEQAFMPEIEAVFRRGAGLPEAVWPVQLSS